VKSCLLALRTARQAGAERIVLRLAKSLEKSYRIDLAALSHAAESQRPKFLGAFAIFFGRYDVIHSHLFLPGLLVRLRRLFDRSFRWVHTVHYCSYQGQRSGRIKRFLDDKLIFPSADALVGVSPSTFDLIRKFPNAVLVENAVDLREREVPGRCAPADVVLGTVAMLRQEKGLTDLIEAMPAVLEVCPQAKLLIAGEGPERKKLERLIFEKGLQGKIQLIGYVDDIESLLKSLTVYVSTSHTESFGMALLEAMQHSLPIVSTDVGAIAQLLKFGEFGKLVSRTRGLTSELSCAVREVLSDLTNWQERSHQGFLFYRRKFDSEAMVDQYREVYERVLRPGVCIISPVITHATGGLQRQIKIQSRELSRLGFHPFVLQRHDPAHPEKTAEWAHATFLSTPNPLPNADSPFWHRFKGVLFVLTGIYRVFQHRREFTFIHAHQLYSPTLVGVVAKKLFGKKLVVKVTASGVLGELRELKRLPFFGLRKLAFSYIDRVIVLSQEMWEEMRELGFSDGKIRLITNGVEVPEHARFDRPFSYAEGDCMNLIYCGRLSREKSLETLIEAAAKLGERGFPCKVHLVGGTYGGRDVTPELKALAARLSDKVSVEFYGAQKEVARYYLSGDAFVLPSVSEGMSNALLEALSYGMPCVASRILPNEALIEDNVNGLLFRQGDVEDLARQLELLARDQKQDSNMSQRLGQTARDTIRQRFSSQCIGRQLKELYLSLDTSKGAVSFQEGLA
jgi:glycosyltransferase involved in cell wall biosynthesis